MSQVNSDSRTMAAGHAIILAAGRSSRMGEQKLLMPFRGMPMVDYVIKTVLSCGFAGTSVVVSRETLDRLTPAEGAEYIVNPAPDRGQDSSFRCALEALPANSPFAVFLADKPMVEAAQVMELRRRFDALDAEKGVPLKSALVPRKDGAPGHPGFYSYIWRGYFLSSGESGKAALFRHEGEVEWLESGDCAAVDEKLFLDIDTKEDYRRLENITRHAAHL